MQNTILTPKQTLEKFSFVLIKKDAPANHQYHSQKDSGNLNHQCGQPFPKSFLYSSKSALSRKPNKEHARNKEQKEPPIQLNTVHRYPFLSHYRHKTLRNESSTFSSRRQYHFFRFFTIFSNSRISSRSIAAVSKSRSRAASVISFSFRRRSFFISP